MNPAVRRLLAVERQQIGVAERPHGSNNVKYNTAFYGHKVKNTKDANYAWCVVFQWWCMQRAGIPTSIFPKSANVHAVRDWYKKKGRFNHTPRVGALVIFSFSHIGLVEKVLPDGRIQTIEGNTDGNGSRTGGRVMRRVRATDIEGYCHPRYARVPRPAAAAVRPPIAAARKQATANRPVAAGAMVVPGKVVRGPVRPALPVRTAVQATSVALPAGKFTAVQFTTATANTGRFWRPPVGTTRGYNLVRGPGVYVADVTVEVRGLSEGARLQFRLVQADPSDHFRIVKEHPVTEITGPDGLTHTTTLSSLGNGHHVWVQLMCDEDVVVPAVTAELVLLAP